MTDIYKNPEFLIRKEISNIRMMGEFINRNPDHELVKEYGSLIKERCDNILELASKWREKTRDINLD